ncbi:MAG: hypothetical protein AAGN82_02320 [Myxococcota bacterium]
MLLFLNRRACSVGAALLGVVAALAAGTGCAESDADLSGPLPFDGPVDDATIAFADERVVAIAPGEEVDITVVTDPPAAYPVSWILSGQTLDASLSRTRTIADENGRATVRMRAPTQATAYVLRARIEGGASATRNVAVSDRGFGRLVVTPDYDGERPVGIWRGGMIAGTTCDALADRLPNDPEGSIALSEGDGGTPLTVETAPVGPNLAIYVRSGHYMWGCSDTDDLEANGTEEVAVTIIDKPLDTSGVALDVDLEFAPEATGWAATLTATEEAMEAVLGDTTTGPSLLLAAMTSASPDPVAFGATAATNGWSADLDAHFQARTIDLSATLGSYTAAGLAALPSNLTGRLDALVDAPGFVQLTLATVGGVTPSELNVPAEYTVALETTPKDVAKFGGSVFFSPSRYVATAAEREALAQNATASDFVDVLVEATACAELSLTGDATCDDTCIAARCRAGLVTMWGHARAASDGTIPGEILMQASGAADYDDFASLTGLTGTWIGQVEVGGGTVPSGVVPVEGVVVATPASSGPTG